MSGLKRLLKRIICFTLVTVMALEVFVQASAADENGVEVKVIGTEYISDVATGTREQLTSAGYTVIEDGTLINERSDTYLGYKTTPNAENGITDLAIMDMYGSYSTLEYKKVLEEQKKGYSEYIEMVKKAITEYRENYNKGNEYALLARDTLNFLVRPAEGNVPDTKMGDYLLNTDLTDEDYLDITMITTSVISNYIYNQLSLGAADAPNEKTWIQRLSEHGPLVFRDEDGDIITNAGTINEIYKKDYDSVYRERAGKLYYTISTFAKKVKAALDYYNANPEFQLEITDAEADKGVQRALNTVKMSLSDNEQAPDENLDGVLEQSQVLLYLTLYLSMDRRDSEGNPVYPYDKDSNGNFRSVGEFLLQTGLKEVTLENQDEVYRTLYALIVPQDEITPLTPGQESTSYLCGFDTMVIYAFRENVSFEETRNSVLKSCNEMKAANDNQLLSVWFGSNRDFYKSDYDGLYWTSELSKKTTSQNRYELLTKQELQTDLTRSQKIKNTAISCGIAAATLFFVGSMTLLITGKVAGIGSSFAAFKIGIMAIAGQTVATSTAACVACVCGTVLIVAAVVCLILLIVYLVKSKKAAEEAEEAKKRIELTEMPKVIYDLCDNLNEDGYAVRYNYVPKVNTTGPCNLLEGIEYQPWYVLYYTKDRNYGEPIAVQTLSDGTVVTPFCITNNTANDDTDHYAPVHYFSSDTAFNLNARRLQNVSSYKYLYMRHPVPTKKGNAKDGKYINNVILSSSADANVAKDNIIRQGYNLIDVDLTAAVIGNRDSRAGTFMENKMYTYIGYTTTDVVDFALTDIRVSYSSGQNPDGGQIYYGSSSYGACGSCNELVMFQTTSVWAGTPILAGSLRVTDTWQDNGDEAIITFGGGKAFDFQSSVYWGVNASNGRNTAIASEYVYSDSNGTFDHKYVYFTPSVKYTSGQQYIGGIAVLEGDDIERFLSENGFEALSDISLINANTYTNQPSYTADLSERQVVAYTTTYNPYRAIYDVRFFSGEVSADTLPYNFKCTNGYTATDLYYWERNKNIDALQALYKETTWAEIDFDTKKKTLIYEQNYMYRKSMPVNNAYRAPLTVRDPFFEPKMRIIKEFTKINDNLYYGSPYRCVNLYVSGNTSTAKSTAEPLKVGEIVLTTSKTYDPSEMTPVRDIKDWYADEPACLTVSTDYWAYKYVKLIRNTSMYGGNSWEKFKYEYTGSYNQSVYMFIKRPDTVKKGTYIKSISIINEDDTEKRKESQAASEIIKYGGKYNQVVFSAVQNGPGVLLPYELSSDYDLNSLNLGTQNPIAGSDEIKIGSTTTNTDCHKGPKMYTDQGKTVLIVPREYSNAQTYVYITYTNDYKEAISDIYVHQSKTEPSEAPEKITLSNGAKVSICGEGFWDGTMDGEDKVYTYLYALYNSGTEVTDFCISKNVMEPGYQTALTSTGEAPKYTRYYFHTKHYQKTTFDYYLKDIVTVEGATDSEAQYKLLEMGIRSCILSDLDPSPDSVLYMAAKRSTSPTIVGTKTQDAISGLLLNDAGQDDTINELIVYNYEYTLMTGAMNKGSKECLIQLYKTVSIAKAHELKPKDPYYEGHYVSDIMLWTDKNLYSLYKNGVTSKMTKKQKETVIKSNINAYLDSLSEEERNYLKPYLLNSLGKPVYWDIVTDSKDHIVNCNKTSVTTFFGKECEGLYLYANYTDGYLRDATKLTGSIFGCDGSLAVIIMCFGILVLTAAALVLIRRKKHMRAAA